MILKDLGEFNLIDRIAKRIKTSPDVVKGIGDDAAILRYKKDKNLLFTCDMLIEGRHFYRRSDPYLIGKKSISVNISDIAAMGGLPKCALVGLGVPVFLDVKFVDRIYKGIKDAAKNFNIDLVGGDTINSKKIIVNISMLGEVEKDRAVLRSGAIEDDIIFITGAIGGSFKEKHLNFTPRLKEARFLVKNLKVHSMIDISDGLIADLGHILKESRKDAVIYERAVPLSKHAKTFQSAIREGEDFELLFTMPQKDACRLKKIWPFKTRLSEIGKVYKGHGEISLLGKDGKKAEIKPVGYSHF